MRVSGIFAASVRKAYTTFVDNFNRTSTPLGTASGGGTWTALRGTWGANGTVATSSDAASSYPISSATMTAQNVTVSADIPQTTSGGAGLAFWITDASNWWGAFPYYTNSVGYSCPSGGSYTGGGVCTVGDSTYSASLAYYCPSGGTLSGTTCSSYSTQNYGLGAPAEGMCLGSGGSYTTANGGTCTFPSYAASTYYTCPTGGSLSGTTCTITGGTYSATSTTTYTSNVRIISSVSGSVTTQATTSVATSTSSYPSIGSLKVITSSNTITASAYAGSGLSGGQRGSNVVLTPSSPVRGFAVGILKATGGDSQATNLDTFNAAV